MNKKTYIIKTTHFLGCSAALALFMTASSASASIFEFHFTGQYTLVGSDGSIADRKAIESTLTYDDATGSGFTGDLSIAEFDTFGFTANIYNISLQRYQDSEYIVGNMLADWNVNEGIPLSMVWDATGLFNAINYNGGLQAGDVISGTNLKRNGVVIADVNSATPASDGGLYIQGPAPLAMTTWNTMTLCTPDVDCIDNALSGGDPYLDDLIAGSPMIDGPFRGLSVNFDIGSGNSLTVTSVNSSVVPIPAAVWLFGSGFIGLVGVARRKQSA